MYIDSLRITNLRTFKEAKEDLVLLHPDTDFKKLDMPKPNLPNVNLLLGDNGSGKTTVLKALAIAALGPAVQDANLPIYRLIRRGPPGESKAAVANIRATFILHPQDHHGAYKELRLESRSVVVRRGEVERVNWVGRDERPWEPIYSSESESFFFVGYGATRRTERRENVDIGARQVTSFERAQRVRSLFEEAYSLVPLSYWLPKENAGRSKQVYTIINQLLKGSGYTFTGKMELGEYGFRQGKAFIPFPALSDGYRAYLGWIGDLLYHVCRTCPNNTKLTDNKGVVMVDEIDLHLHPKWQMTVLPQLANALKKIQFIVTSHSPLIVGSLEWMNIIKMEQGPNKVTMAHRIREAVHGLDADQVLVTSFFDMSSTRVDVQESALKDLSRKAGMGDRRAAEKLVKQWSTGLEKKKA